MPHLSDWVVVSRRMRPRMICILPRIMAEQEGDHRGGDLTRLTPAEGAAPPEVVAVADGGVQEDGYRDGP